MKNIILASNSPRRREILNQVGIEFQVIPSDCSEDISINDPAEMVMQLSSMKCRNVADKIINKAIVPDADTDNGFIVIGSDTIVVYDGQVLGKPSSAEEAFDTLRMLSGNTHVVFTGVTLIDTSDGTSRSFYEKTEVTMFDVSDEDIRNYIATGDPLDKAGSYGIQGPGAFLIEKINGDYYTVVGLPIGRLCQELKDFNN